MVQEHESHSHTTDRHKYIYITYTVFDRQNTHFYNIDSETNFIHF